MLPIVVNAAAAALTVNSAAAAASEPNVGRVVASAQIVREAPARSLGWPCQFFGA
jgi:hypothetical protein